MSKYLEMWAKIKETTEKERLEFLDEHPVAIAKDLEFKGQMFFDVDLLEAIRNSLK